MFSSHFLTNLMLMLAIDGFLNAKVWANGRKITILHTNDVHARFAQTNKDGGACTENDEKIDNCFGGLARLHHKIKEIRAKDPNVLDLSAGDYYQGTAWYSIYKWRAVSHFANILNHTAMVLGNHEFDDNIDGLMPFVESSVFPILSSNIDASEEPRFLEKQRNGKIAKSVVVQLENGLKVGVIGYTLRDTMLTSNPGKLIFLDEVKSVKEEAQKLNGQGVGILIALGHAGFDLDLRIAAEVPFIDVVVGGHSNTFLYTGTPPHKEKPLGPYPTMVTNKASGIEVPVVQAFAYTKYLGYLEVTFDNNGDVVKAEGNPILMDSSVPPDEDMLKQIKDWGKLVREKTQQELGQTKVFLNGKARECELRECNLGSFFADAMVFELSKLNTAWSHVEMAIVHGGSIRDSIDETVNNGSITLEDVLRIAPYQNTVDVVELKGSDLKEVFEFSVKGYDPNGHTAGKFLQISGIIIVFDISKPEGERVKSLQVVCKECGESQYVPFDSEAVYKVAVPTFIRNGDDGFAVLRDQSIATHDTGVIDSDLLVSYIKYRSPITQGVEGRIRFIDSSQKGCGEGDIIPPSCIIEYPKA